jgi:hypothetical protein
LYPQSSRIVFHKTRNKIATFDNLFFQRVDVQREKSSDIAVLSPNSKTTLDAVLFSLIELKNFFCQHGGSGSSPNYENV